MSGDNYIRPLSERDVAILNGVALKGLAERLESQGAASISTVELMELAERMIIRANRIDAESAGAE